MKRKIKFIALLFAAHVIIPAQGAVYKGDTKANGTVKNLSAGCAPATSREELNINNTVALIQSGGDMWWNLTNNPRYEIPKGSGNHALFAGSLWLGGKDVSGQLKVAALRFRQVGNDYWTGPLSTVTGEIDPATCSEYDKHFVTTRDEVATFVGWFQAGLFDSENGTNTQEQNYPGYNIPESILEWPAHGRNYPPYDEDFYLAPFIDYNGDGFYNPLDGDYPGYDLSGENDCREKIVNIYGDQNLWWVFNDKGNIHTETGSQAIGMEIRAQAFAFATNDEVNNMTFYNYELVNRSTFTLTETYFGQWVDPDLGNAQDDFVGCDVQRGLGYCYNGDNNDEDNGGAKGYGILPPAIGVDFFQGPFQDNDGLDNPLTSDYQRAVAEHGIPYQGIGIGYGDSIPDNERFGMRKFLYHNNNSSPTGDPRTGVEYYNYLRAFWRDGSRMVYGGTGFPGGASTTVEADYMFPGDTDPYGWGTGGVPQPSWTEESAGNSPFDRRFMQSAGPFTLQPGAVNNITVGVVWARAKTGNPFSSVQAVRRADDKTQALFDNCFRILSGPDAPDLVVQELDKELILYITNRSLSNNYNENYSEVDPFIIPPDTIFNDDNTFKVLTPAEKEEYATYRFQGYKIYQVKDNAVSVSDLEDPDLARLVFQCDVKDEVSRIINFPIDEDLGISVPKLMVDGANEGITKAIKITQDQFADGDNRLVNHKSYYFIAVAYAYNNYEAYDPNNPNPEAQLRPYLGSRKSATGPILIASGIPHRVETENGGTVLNAQFGDEIPVTRIEGTGNGGHFLRLDYDMLDKATEAPNYRIEKPTYLPGGSPIKVKVIDPLNIKPGNFTVQFIDTTDASDLTNATYIIYGDNYEDTIALDKTIEVGTENLLLDLGISVSIEQAKAPGTPEVINNSNGYIGAALNFPDGQWLLGISDIDGFSPLNWILSGTGAADNDAATPEFEPDYNDWDWYFSNGINVNRTIDPQQVYENVLDGIFSPFRLAADHAFGPIPYLTGKRPTAAARSNIFSAIDWVAQKDKNHLMYLESVDIIFTDDKTKWSRVPVIEMSDTNSVDNVLRGRLRSSPSLDKNGNPAQVGALNSTDPNSPAYIGATGMSWFPGYAVNTETGERLNMAFGEASYFANENGRDMIWNPTSNVTEGPFSDIRMGGLHYIMVFRNNIVEDGQYQFTQQYNDPVNRMPAYDNGKYLYEQLIANSTQSITNVYRAGMWVGLPLLNPEFEFKSMAEGLVPGFGHIAIRVNVPYRTYATGEYLSPGDNLTPGVKYYVEKGSIIYGTTNYKRGQYFVATGDQTTFSVPATEADIKDNIIATENGGLPLYTFNLDNLVPTFNDKSTAEKALDLINVVPNPYYAYSQYETDKIDNRVRITNLPQLAYVNIYTVNGTLVRSFVKDDASVSFLDWDLKNQYKTPIASGIYIIHIEVPGVGERILKWFGMMRPIDLDAF